MMWILDEKDINFCFVFFLVSLLVLHLQRHITKIFKKKNTFSKGTIVGVYISIYIFVYTGLGLIRK